MEERIKESDIERISNEMTEIYMRKYSNNRLGKPLITSKDKHDNLDVFHFVEMYNDGKVKQVKFKGEYKEKARLMDELKPLIDYLDREGYQWI